MKDKKRGQCEFGHSPAAWWLSCMLKESGWAGARPLCEAVSRVRSGLINADLGGGVIKQRITRRGSGRSSGFRTFVLFRRDELAFFVYGFDKNARANLRRDELEAFRRLADQYLALDRACLAAAQASGAIIEMRCDEQAI